MEIDVSARPGPRDAECPFCLSDLTGARVTCEECGVQVHTACSLELKRCTTAGCAGVWNEPVTIELTRPTSRATYRRGNTDGDVDVSLLDGPCPGCQQALSGQLTSCLMCRVMIHPGCAVDLVRCPTVGCAGVWDTSSARDDARRVLLRELDPRFGRSTFRLSPGVMGVGFSVLFPIVVLVGGGCLLWVLIM